MTFPGGKLVRVATMLTPQKKIESKWIEAIPVTSEMITALGKR